MLVREEGKTMNKLYVARWMFFFLLVFTAGGVHSAQDDAKRKGAEAWKSFRVQERYAGKMQLKTKEGKTIALSVATRVWSIDATLGPQALHVNDFTVFQLRGGKVKALIEGVENTRSTDEYWTVPAGATMTLEVKGETALLEAMTVSE